MNQGNPEQRTGAVQGVKASNKRTGFILASVAFAFFCGVVAKKLLLG